MTEYPAEWIGKDSDPVLIEIDQGEVTIWGNFDQIEKISRYTSKEWKVPGGVERMVEHIRIAIEYGGEVLKGKLEKEGE